MVLLDFEAAASASIDIEGSSVTRIFSEKKKEKMSKIKEVTEPYLSQTKGY